MATPVKLHTAEIGFDLPMSSNKTKSGRKRPKSASRKKGASRTPMNTPGQYRYSEQDLSPKKKSGGGRGTSSGLGGSSRQAWGGSNPSESDGRYIVEEPELDAEWGLYAQEESMERYESPSTSTTSSIGHRRAWGDDQDTQSLASSRDSLFSQQDSLSEFSGRPSTAGSTRSASSSSSFRDQSLQQQRTRFRDYALNSARKQSKKTLSAKQKWQQEMKSINHNIDKTQRELRSLTTHSRNKDVKQEFVAIHQLVKSQQAELIKEEQQLNEDLSQLRITIRDVAHSVQNAQTNEEFVERLQELLESAEEQILQFKNQQRSQYESLSAQQKILDREVAAYESRFNSDSWDDLVIHELKPKLAKDLAAMVGGSGSSSTSSSANNDSPKAKSSRPSTSRGSSRIMETIQDNSLPEEIEIFDKFVRENGGHHGDWDEKEHTQFVRLYKKYHYLVEKGRDEDFFDQITSAFPYQDSQSIMEHCDWYETYCILNDKKKMAIQRWREAKQAAKQSNLKELEESKQEKEKAARKKKLRKQKEQQEKREKLKKWKEEKEQRKLKALEEAAEQEQREKQEKMRRIKQQKQRSQRIKSLVDDRKADEERLREIQQQIADSEKRHQNTLTSEQRIQERQRLQARDKQIIEKRQSLINKKQREKDEIRLKQEALIEHARPNFNVKRDPERLTRNTAALKEKFKPTKDTIGRSQGPISTNKIQHRMTPSWRKGL